jgi:hypothetical protein
VQFSPASPARPLLSTKLEPASVRIAGKEARILYVWTSPQYRQENCPQTALSPLMEALHNGRDLFLRQAVTQTTSITSVLHVIPRGS